MRTLTIIAKIILVVLIVAGFGGLALWQAGASTTDTRCPAWASRCVYTAPASVRAARAACFRAEADSRGIPTDRDAYLEWWDTHQGTTSHRAWMSAYQGCLDRNVTPGGMWNWSALVFVRAEA